MTIIYCPKCELEFVVSASVDELEVDFSFEEWTRRCRDQRGDTAALCRHLRPWLDQQLPGQGHQRLATSEEDIARHQTARRSKVR